MPGTGPLSKFLRELGTSLVVQWPRLHTLNAGGPGAIPGQRTRSHRPHLMIPHPATRTWHSHISKYFFLNKYNSGLPWWFSW